LPPLRRDALRLSAVSECRRRRAGVRDPEGWDHLGLVGLLRRYSNLGDEVKRLESLLDLPSSAAVELPASVPRLRVHLSEADERRLVLRYSQGVTIRQLASEFGVNREKVSAILVANDVPRRSHSTVTVDLDRASELEGEGLSLIWEDRYPRGSKSSGGLARRRKMEAQLFLDGTYN
jgi:hypothetical protein